MKSVHFLALALLPGAFLLTSGTVLLIYDHSTAGGWIAFAGVLTLAGMRVSYQDSDP